MRANPVKSCRGQWFLAWLLAGLAIPAGAPRAQDRLVFGGDHEYPPYEYLNEAGNPVGFNVELVQALARELGTPVEIRLAPWPEIVRQFEVEKSIDFTDMFWTREREKRVEFTVPFAVVFDELFVRRDTPAACHYEDLAGKLVIVQRASTTEEFLSAHEPDAILIPVDSEPAALRLLAAGFHDCALVTQITGRLAIQKYNLTNLVASGKPVRPRDYAYVVVKGNVVLRDRINAALTAVKTSGEYQRIYIRWFGDLEPPTPAQALLRAYGWWALGVTLALALAIVAWNLTLTVRVRARTRELAATNQRLRDLFDSGNDSILVVEPGSGRILDANRRTVELYGYSRDELLNMRVHDLGPPEAAPQAEAILQQLMNEGRAMFERSNRHRDGQIVHVEVSSRLITLDGQPVIESFVRDISDRKQSEIERERLLHDLERRTAEMESFVYTISHDLKAPLITITGFAKLLEKDLARGDAAQSADSLGEIIKASDGMQALIEDLLALARTGQIVGESKEVNLKDLVAALRSRCAQHIEQVRGRVQLVGDLPHLRVDPVRFGQVLQNLVENALTYHRPGVPPEIEIGSKRANGEFRLYVGDNGAGIPPAYRERIFGLFQRLDTRTEGTGVGLAIARRIVEMHGGRIWAESEPGKGSIFWIALPDSVIVNGSKASES